MDFKPHPFPFYPGETVVPQKKELMCSLCFTNMVANDGDRCARCRGMNITPVPCSKCRMNFVNNANELCKECIKTDIQNPFQMDLTKCKTCGKSTLLSFDRCTCFSRTTTFF